MTAISVILLSIIIFLALVVNMALKPAYSAKLTAVMMTAAVLGGSIIYGKGYSDVTGNLAVSLVRTPYSVIGMFLGKNDLAAIGGASVVSGAAGIFIFWLLHSVAFYSMTSAAMITVGSEWLRRLRLFLITGDSLTIIYGINEESLKVGKECSEAEDNSVIFITDNESDDRIPEIINLGMAVLTGGAAVRSEVSELKKLRIRGRDKIEIFALDEDVNENLYYALGLKKAFEQMGVLPEKTSITIPGTEEIITSMLQISEDSYGFGYVNVFDPPDMMARAMIRLCPPWEQVRFDRYGRAVEDFDCVVIGSGDCGQAALRYLVMNAQFVGSRFHAAMFAPNFKLEAGYLFAECRGLLDRYDIEFLQSDGRSLEFYAYLGERLKTLKYIAICAGSDEMNAEISDHIMLYLKRERAEHICVLECTRKGVRYQVSVGGPLVTRDVYSYDMLSAVKEDKNGMIINSQYDNSDRTDWEKWGACNSFGKMSSRASAEFLPAIIRAAGSTVEEAMRDEWIEELGGDKLNVLGEMEHERWCAFHFANGYRTMTDEIFEKKAEEYREAVRRGEKANPRIGKDTEKRMHACMIPYDQLDALSEKEKAVTGRDVNYRQADINNVMIIPRILREQRSGAEE